MTVEARRRLGLARPAVRARGRAPAGEHLLLWLVTAAVFAYLFVPVAVVVVYSFNSERSLSQFGGMSLRWYRTLADDDTVLSALGASLQVAAGATVVATVLGTMLAIGLVRLRARIAGPANILMLLPLVTPEIVTAIALLIVFTQAGQTLSLATVLLGHVTFSISYVAVVVRGRLATMDRRVEEAALDLGSTHPGALLRVVLPAIRPAVLSAAALVFAFSFDDFVTSYFTSGNGVPPLPVVIYSMIKYGVTPEINAIGTLMLVASLFLFAVALLIAGRAYRGLGLLTGGRT